MVKKKTRSSHRGGCRRFVPFSSSPWFLFVVVFVVLELAVLAFLVTQLEHQTQHHHTQHFSWNLASWRRSFLRYFDPKWRPKNHRHQDFEDKSNLHAPPAFHHSVLARNRFLVTKRNRLVQHNASETKPLDNFYRRHHIGKQVPFLIVGGSDGSGTRMYVQMLIDLGVTMIVDDYNTMDVHGEEMEFTLENGEVQRGWPPLVQIVLNTTHSVNYTLQDLPRQVQQTAMSALLKLKSSLIKKAKEMNRLKTNVFVPTASGAQYGWKAPISLTLLPLLAQAFGPLKFIHVVRDGRDVALSDNQGPVLKYYHRYYQKDDNFPLRRSQDQVHAMQLWNDWNLEALEYEQHQQKLQDYQQYLSHGHQSVPDGEENPNYHFDYMVMRTEDLVQPSTRFEALAQLAEFAGARLSRLEICCLSQRSLRDLGRHSDTDMEGDNNNRVEDEESIIARYGKWKDLGNMQLESIKQIESAGSESLKAFGYSPEQRFLDVSVDVQAFTCDRTVQQRVGCKF